MEESGFQWACPMYVTSLTRFQNSPIFFKYSLTTQTQIEFPKGIKTVFIVKKWKDKASSDAALALVDLLITVQPQKKPKIHYQDYGCKIFLEQIVIEEEEFLNRADVWDISKRSEIDILIVLGGDGTLLHANSLFQGFHLKYFSKIVLFDIFLLLLFG